MEGVVSFMDDLSPFCTCTDYACPLHPTNHDRGCAPCVAKNLQQREIPSCFFNKLNTGEKQMSFFFEDFAKAVANQKPQILKAEFDDLPTILELQYLAYQSEAALFGGRDIPPLTQTLDEVIAEYQEGVVLKLVDETHGIIGSVRAKERDGTVYIGKLMVHPDHQHKGYGSRLLKEVECVFPGKRYELFTSTRSLDNVKLYQKFGYQVFDRKKVDDELEFVYLEKLTNPGTM